MAKILVFAVMGLLAIGTLGWAVGNQQRHQDVPQSDVRLPVATVSKGRTRLEPAMLAGWMERRENACLIVDIRSVEDYEQRHLSRAINREFSALIDLQSLRRLPRHRPIVIYGDDPEKAAAAAEVLRLSGLAAFYLPVDPQVWQLLAWVGRDVDGSSRFVAGQISAEVGTALRPSQETVDADQPSDQRGGQQPAMIAGADSDAMMQLGFLGGE